MKTSNYITEKHIDHLIAQSDVEEYIFFGKCLMVCLKLPNGFTVTGEGACVDPANFDLEIGRSVAYGKIKDKLWLLEGYLLQNKLVSQGVLTNE